MPKPIPPDDALPSPEKQCTHCGDFPNTNCPGGLCRICWGRSRITLSCPMCGETFALRRPGCSTVETELDTAFARVMQRASSTEGEES